MQERMSGSPRVTWPHTPCPDTLVDFRASPDTLEMLPGHCFYCQSPCRAAQLKHPQHRGPCLAKALPCICHATGRLS